MTTQEIARRVKLARQAAGLSQEELGQRLGLTKVGYGEYERAHRVLDTEQLAKLGRVLGQPITYFLGLDTGLTEDEGRVLALYREARAAGVGSIAMAVLEGVVGR
jgi:transcriptional regulator with XRE-family HTH domain